MDELQKYKALIDEQQQQLKSNANTIAAQRHQIRSLMDKLAELEDGGEVESANSMNLDRWKMAMEQIDKLKKHLADARIFADGLPLLPVRKSVIVNRIEDCRCEAVRLEQSISHIANSTVRRGYKNEE
jgi:hypothetical protein